MTCIRLHVIAEGQTEERFVEQILAPHFGKYNITMDARCVLTSKDKRKHKIYRGGLFQYEKARYDITTWMKQDDHNECVFTTMFDLYALPRDFPDFNQAMQCQDPYEKVGILESAFKKDINHPRFIPYIQLHEFESLILADPQQLDWEYLDHEQSIRRIVEMVDQEGGNPELIDDGEETSPSKRIIKELPYYDKANAGILILKQIKLATLRMKCPHFHKWLEQLECSSKSSESAFD